MRYDLLTATLVMALCISNIAMAAEPAAVVVCEDNSCTTTTTLIATVPPVIVNEHPFRYGFSLTVGAPSGIALGFILHPKTDAISLEAAFTENILSPGGMLSIKLDPLALKPRWPIALFADIQGGFTGKGNVPGHSSNLPSIGYEYVNFYGGLRLGWAKNFHWLIEVGPSYLNISTSNFQSIVSKANGLTLSNLSATAWVVPTFVTGFEVCWP